MAAAPAPVRLNGAAIHEGWAPEVSLFASPSAKNRASRAVLLTLRLFHRLDWSETLLGFVTPEGVLLSEAAVKKSSREMLGSFRCAMQLASDSNGSAGGVSKSTVVWKLVETRACSMWLLLR